MFSDISDLGWDFVSVNGEIIRGSLVPILDESALSDGDEFVLLEYQG
jgi:hypothetical protein